MVKYETIKSRYIQGYITDSQLERYAKLKQITTEQLEEIKNSK